MARLSLCPALAPPRGLTIPLTPEDKHIKLLGSPSAPGDSRHRLRPVPEGPVPEEVRTAATLDCQLLLAVIGVTGGDRCGPVDPVTGTPGWASPGGPRVQKGGPSGSASPNSRSEGGRDCICIVGIFYFCLPSICLHFWPQKLNFLIGELYESCVYYVCLMLRHPGALLTLELVNFQRQ